MNPTTNGHTTGEHKKDFILAEYQIVTDKINMLVNYDLKIMNIGLIIFGVGFGYGMGDNVNNKLLLVFFPFAIYIVLLFALHVYIIVTSLCGYKKCLEEYINKNFMRQNIFLGEALNAKFTFTSIALYGSYIFYAALLFFGIYKSVQEARTEFGSLGSTIIILVHLCSLLIIGLSGYKFMTTLASAYEFAKQKFSEEAK